MTQGGMNKKIDISQLRVTEHDLEIAILTGYSPTIQYYADRLSSILEGIKEKYVQDKPEESVPHSQEGAERRNDAQDRGDDRRDG